MLCVQVPIQSLCSRLEQVEHFNQTLDTMLSKIVADHQKDCDDHLQTHCSVCIPNISYDSIRFSVMIGRSPTLSVDAIFNRSYTAKTVHT